MCAMMQKLRTFAGLFETGSDCGSITGVGSLERAIVALLDEPPAERLVEEDYDQERDVEAADRRNDAPHRLQHRLDQARDENRPLAADARDPRRERVDQHDPEVELEDVAGDGVELARNHVYCTSSVYGSDASTSCGTPLRYGA